MLGPTIRGSLAGFAPPAISEFITAQTLRTGIQLLHEGHGSEPKVMQIGRTPTQRAGKVNSESFRVVRFEGCKAVPFTYAGDKTAPIPLPRHEPSPLQITFSPANDGTRDAVTARVENRWQQDFPNSRLTFVMPKGAYKVDRGRIESTVVSDDSRFVIVTVRFDLPAKSVVSVAATAQ